MALKRYPHIVFSVLACVLIIGVGFPAIAQASPSSATIDSKRAEAAEAQDRLDELAADLEERTEDYLEAESALAQTRLLISQSESEIESATADLQAADARLNQRVVTAYRAGRLNLFSVFLGITDFRDFVSRIDLVRRIARTDATAVADVKHAKQRLESAREGLERRRGEQVVLREKARTEQGRVSHARSQQESVLAGINSDLKRLIAQEKARREAAAREAAARAAAASAVAGRVYSSNRTFDPSGLGEPHPRALEAALEFVGVTPYVWGGVTPAGFDCSGLTQYVYAGIGISIPRTSRAQFLMAGYIPPDRLELLEKGDLLFFGRDGDPARVHHVALFAGDGMMVHAPQTGELVSVTSLIGRIAARGDYVGAVRP